MSARPARIRVPGGAVALALWAIAAATPVYSGEGATTAPAAAGADAATAGAEAAAGADAATAGADAAADSAGAGWRTSAGVISQSPPVAPSPASRLRFHRDELRPHWRDVAFVAAATTASVLIAQQDRELTDRVTARDSHAQRDLARIVRPFGYEVVVGGAVAAWGGAWLAHRDALFASVQRADISIACAALCAFAVKEIVGRKRPEKSPGDAMAFEPLSGHDSFPSGHATLAFAAAAVLDRETSSHWATVAYPLAGLVAWSRVHDRKHWTSDVVAGAAIGFGVAWKAEDVLRGRASSNVIGARVELAAGGHGTLAAARVRW